MDCFLKFGLSDVDAAELRNEMVEYRCYLLHIDSYSYWSLAVRVYALKVNPK